ncbi:hypothetical protein [Streptomyces tibetensis]|uniref:hypothetical protein n=1 Tax=Streptomyces tibetensis TaxID=2382123 RepID=UPI0033E99669
MYKDYWEIPGGYVETGGRLGPEGAEGDKVLYLFDGDQLGRDDLARIRLQPEELKSFAFFTPEQISEHTIPRLARRVIAVTEARAAASPVYLEHGRRPGTEAA